MNEERLKSDEMLSDDEVTIINWFLSKEIGGIYPDYINGDESSKPNFSEYFSYFLAKFCFFAWQVYRKTIYGIKSRFL